MHFQHMLDSLHEKKNTSQLPRHSQEAIQHLPPALHLHQVPLFFPHSLLPAQGIYRRSSQQPLAPCSSSNTTVFRKKPFLGPSQAHKPCSPSSIRPSWVPQMVLGHSWNLCKAWGLQHTGGTGLSRQQQVLGRSRV